MTRIKNYNELIAERKRLEGEIKRSKEAIAEGLHGLKKKFEPFLYLLPALAIFKTKTSVLKVLATLAMNAIVNKSILSRSTWLTRFIIPVLRKII
jgi:hypothetical protein